MVNRRRVDLVGSAAVVAVSCDGPVQTVEQSGQRVAGPASKHSECVAATGCAGDAFEWCESPASDATAVGKPGFMFVHCVLQQVGRQRCGRSSPILLVRCVGVPSCRAGRCGWCAHSCALTGSRTHGGRRALVRAQVASEELVALVEGNWPYLVLEPAVVHGKSPVIGEPGQRLPAPQLCYTLALAEPSDAFWHCRVVFPINRVELLVVASAKWVVEVGNFTTIQRVVLVNYCLQVSLIHIT